MIERLYTLLRGMGLEVWVSVRDTEQHYALQPPARHIMDRVKGGGPLGGIMACLQEIGTDWLLVVACDMPLIAENAVRTLLQAREDDVDAVVAQTPDGRWHPLFALYHRRCLSKIKAYLADGGRSLHGLLERLPHVQWVVLDFQEMLNLNHPDDWPAQDISGV